MKPASSSPSTFQPLRDEHVDGMVFANRLRDFARQVAPERIARYTGWYWMHHIRPHFFHEEKILLPFLPAGNLLAKRLRDEHADIRDLILQLDREPDAHDFKLLAKLLEHHIRFEETELFPWLETHLTENELGQVKTAIAACPLQRSTWTDAFWETVA